MRDENLTKRDYVAAAIYQGLLFKNQDEWTALPRAFRLADEFIKLSRLSPEEISGIKEENNDRHG